MGSKQDEQFNVKPRFSNQEELDAYEKIVNLKNNCPINDKEILANLGLFISRPLFVRMNFMHNLYLKILKTHGIIMEFGVYWGQNMALFSTFRNIYEPYNIRRKIIGFDTFEGFPSVSKKDGSYEGATIGALATSVGYENYLNDLLTEHKRLGPRGHAQKHEIIKGNVEDTLQIYLEDNPETIIALAYFDLDLYEPTKKCLELIKPYLAKNSIVGFDELASEDWPGETLALKETWGISGLEIIRDPISPYQSYILFS